MENFHELRTERESDWCTIKVQTAAEEKKSISVKGRGQREYKTGVQSRFRMGAPWRKIRYGPWTKRNNKTGV